MSVSGSPRSNPSTETHVRTWERGLTAMFAAVPQRSLLHLRERPSRFNQMNV